MSERSLRKRPEATPVVDRKRSVVQKAAVEVLQGFHGGSARQAAAHFQLSNHSSVAYWVDKYRGSELVQLIPAPDQTPIAAEERSASPLLTVMPDEVKEGSVYNRKQWVAKAAAKLVTSGECSMRAAAEMVAAKYDMTVSIGTISNYSNEEYSPQGGGRKSVLPPKFTEKIIAWITARRALKFPVFRDDVLAVANRMLLGSPLLDKLKHHMLDVGWYYRMLNSNSHLIGTANQRPLEIDRARWCTASNVKEWYGMLAEALVELKVAIYNADFLDDADPSTRAGQPIIITKPDRLISFDETRVEMDMTKASKAKQERTLVDKMSPPDERNEVLAHKGGLNGTGVGGSAACGNTLPALFILAGGGLTPAHTKPSPDCDYFDGDGRMITAKFTANKKGGVDTDIGVQYLSQVIAPVFQPTADNPLVVICDGHGSHLTLSLLEYCRSASIFIILRVPHTSHLLQGEDVSSFSCFKPELRRQKAKMLVANVEKCGYYGLHPSDFMKVVTPAWNKAFSKANNLQGWSLTGICPFTRKVMHDLIRAEACRISVASTGSGIDYTPLNSLSGGQVRIDSDESDDEEGGAVARGRISSAQLYALGPVTGDKAFSIVKARAEDKAKQAADKEARKESRVESKDVKLAELRSAVADYPNPTSEQVEKFTIPMLKGVLLRDDGQHWESVYSKLKSKAELKAAVLQLCGVVAPAQSTESASSSEHRECLQLTTH
jgi:hypothetical protein